MILITEGLFVFGGGGLAALVGFTTAVKASQKKNPDAFAKGMVNGGDVMWAFRALGWGTLYAFAGTGVFVFTVKTIMGVHSWKEFGEKMSRGMKKIIPPMKKKGENAQKDAYSEMIEAAFRERDSKKTLVAEHTCGIDKGS
ncbi:hypothetical protein FSP39_023012 [Pinctada imbricata]|uniref:Transmembrane protein 242 n=1 Tax=Pinctada imbricata TaxID=66713 RepID=A0AA89C4C2_PINIB|nr:hypothetical protein FSP39_023012 [Pinctada imbricata]